MGKKVDRQVAARMLYAAQEMMESAAALVPWDDVDHNGDSTRNLVLDMANQVRLLAGDVSGAGRG